MTTDNDNAFTDYHHASILDSALDYAKYDMKVIPICSHDHKGMSHAHLKTCPNKGKVPIINNWLERASSDPATISSWFEDFPNANIGIVLGSLTGIVAIDVDGDYGKQRVLDIFGDVPPTTWEFKTPGGGYRYLFKAPPGHKFHKYTDSKPDALHQEIAFLGDGQQTLMPPSIHNNDGIYKWVLGKSPTDIPLALAPDVMLNKMDKRDSAIMLVEKSLLQLHSTDSLVLQNLQGKCKQINTSVAAQISLGGVDEQTWFNTASLLNKVGSIDDAMAFSKLSSKHNDWSQTRIEDMDSKKGEETYGPTRCTTLGCDVDQIQKCFSRVLKNDSGELTNSPAAFVKIPTIKENTFIESLLAQTDYKIFNGDLCDIIYAKDGGKSYKPFANFVAYPTETIIVDNGVATEDFFLIEGMILKGNQQLEPLRVLKSEFNDMKWIINWGLRPNLYPGLSSKEKMRHALQQMAMNAKQSYVYGHLGFRNISGEWRYLHSHGCIGLEEVLVEIDSRLDKYILPSKSIVTKDSILQCLELLKVAPIRVTLPLLASVFLAPLCEILRQVGIEPSFIVWIYGLTGTRKSTLTALFLCHFGKFAAKNPPASFKDTANSLEKRTSDCKDSLFWIDDYHPTNSPTDGKKMAQIAQSLLRSYGDRVGRGRMRIDTSIRKDYIPRGLAIVTGEQLPEGHSSNSRFVGIELHPDDVDLPMLSLAQQKTNDLSLTMSGYVEWIGKKMSDESFGKGLLRTYEKNRDLALPSQTHGRLAETAAWLYLGLESFLDYAINEKAIDSEYQTAMLTDGWDTLLSLSETQSDQVLETRPTSKFLSIVSSLLANSSIHVLPADKKELEQLEGITPPGKHVGWYNKDYFFLMPDVIYNEVSIFLSRQNEQNPLLPSALWNQLHTEQVLEAERYTEKGKTKVKFVRGKGINGQKMSTIWIKHEALKESDLVSDARKPRQATEASALFK